MSRRPLPTSYSLPSGGASSCKGGSLPPAAGLAAPPSVTPSCVLARPSCSCRSFGSVSLLVWVHSSGLHEVDILLLSLPSLSFFHALDFRLDSQAVFFL